MITCRPVVRATNSRNQRLWGKLQSTAKSPFTYILCVSMLAWFKLPYSNKVMKIHFQKHSVLQNGLSQIHSNQQEVIEFSLQWVCSLLFLICHSSIQNLRYLILYSKTARVIMLYSFYKLPGRGRSHRPHHHPRNVRCCTEVKCGSHLVL